MSWLNPSMAWWLLLVPVLVALYMLRPRPVRKPVPSLRLWQGLPDVARPKARLRRPPLSLLLLLQALLLAAGAFALMQPALATPEGRQTVILLDASGSMQAADNGSTRFEQAKNEAHNLASSMRPQDRTTLLRVGANIITLCSACPSGDLQNAISAAQPGAGRAEMAAALNVAQGLARRSPEGSVQAIVISDGAFDAVPAEDLPPSVRFVQVGAPENNVAITQLSARQPPDGSPGYSAFARIDNLGGSQVDIQVTSFADTVPQQARQLTLPAGGHGDIVWQLPAGTVRFTVNIAPQDALQADNGGVLFLPAGQHKVVISSPQPDLYARALSGVPGLQTVSGTLTGTEQPAFSIIEGQIPDSLPGGNLLLVNPTGSLLASTGEMQNVTPLAADPANPILGGVDLGALVVQRAPQLVVPSWLQSVVQSQGGPLLLTGEADGRRIAVLAFDPSNSNLTKLAAFPLLMANLADWLYPLADTQALHPGQTITLAPGSTVVAPGKEQTQVGPSGQFMETEEQGVYSVQSGQRVGSSSAEQFAVNMTDVQESNLRIQAHPELNRQPPASQEKLTMQELWLPLALTALLLSGVEWLFYCLKRGRM